MESRNRDGEGIRFVGSVCLWGAHGEAMNRKTQTTAISVKVLVVKSDL